ncbi:amino acid/polyamine transporter [Novosphingobium nitrogenifigens DSM 19370]|uniref:Amino acid/polyamine transporter n=1 Tax=Novosphingobium nitrogenifigens DSM 19370 TaxID=983920 RepID=F1ZAV1_9SPHN|nr:amino acid permease [Novosphingobium nitrogenifigens]EGD58271.1 amino acid/polyamine transporter [Novosphingobium nitrogenifigens DSM 19370]
MAQTESLDHSLKSRHVTMISIGGIIGAGIFVGSSVAIHIAGPAVLATYFLCGLLVFVIMRMLGEMAMARPGVGSFTGYTSLGLGPWAGFTNAWLYSYFWIITIAVEAIAGANMLMPFIPLPMWALAALLIAAMTAVNLMSVKTYGEFEFWFASLKVVTIIGFISLGLGYVFGFGPGLAALAHQFEQHGGFTPSGWSAVFLAIPTVIFSMMGSEVATIAAVETEDPARNVVRAGRTVALRIMFFYIGSITVIQAILPWDLVESGKSPFVAALGMIHIPGAEALIGAVIFTAIISCLNSAIYVTSRMLYEMGQRGDAPGLFTRVSSTKVPAGGIIFASVLGFGVVLTSVLSPNGLFAFLVQSSGATILCVYLLIAFAQIQLRKRLEKSGEVLGVKVWLFPVVSYAAAISILAVLVMMLLSPDQYLEVLLSTGVFAACVVAYWIRARIGRAPVALAEGA